jgi:hypothetical protein
MRILWVSYYYEGKNFLSDVFGVVEERTDLIITKRQWFEGLLLQANVLVRECWENKFDLVVLTYPFYTRFDEIDHVDVEVAIIGFKDTGAKVALLMDGPWSDKSYGENLRIPYPISPPELIKIIKELPPNV